MSGRENVESKYKWRLQDIFPDNEAWDKSFISLQTLMKEIEGKQGVISGLANKVAESNVSATSNVSAASATSAPSNALGVSDATEVVEQIAEILDLSERIEMMAERLYLYARMKKDEDFNDTTYVAMTDKIQGLLVRLAASSAFIEPELLEWEQKTVLEWCKTCPRLAGYERFFNEMFRGKQHVLSKSEERLMAQTGEMSEVADNIFSMFANSDLKLGTIVDEEGKQVVLTNANYIPFMESADRRVRREAFNAMYSSYGSFQNTIAAAYTGHIKGSVFYKDARKYESCLDMFLFPDNVDSKVYTNLIKTVDDNLEVFDEYLKLRKRKLGLDELHMYDLYTPISLAEDEVAKTYSYEEAVEIVKAGTAALGEDYTAMLTEGFENGWVDVYENEGKRSGAYSWGGYDTHPYVLLNYHGTLNDVLTIAHEMGHSIHTNLSNKSQPYVYAQYRIFVAEVASTVNEILVTRYLLDKLKDKPQERAFLLNRYLEDFRGTVFRQTMFAEFEKAAHELVESGEGVTATELNDIYYGLNKKYFGKTVEVDKEIQVEWARIPHFYTDFYVYKYATGFSAATAIAKGIAEEGEPAVERYKKFLSGGGSDSPLELLKIAGVDLSTPKPVEAAMKEFEAALKELGEILG